MTFPDIRAGNPLKQTLAAGGTAVGTFVRMPTIEVVELAGHGGCDFVLIDMEHSTVTWEHAAAMALAAESSGTVPVIRLSHGRRDAVSRALDIGAHGVMVAQVETAEEAASIVAATRFGPGGTRGAARTRRTGFGLTVPLDEFVPAANAATFVSVQVETLAAVANVETIAAVDGLDCVFVGLSDLSVDLELPGAWDHPEVVEQVDRVQAACDAAGVACGLPAGSAAFARPFMERGARFIATGDVGVFAAGIQAYVEEVRRSVD